jgi:hypothetical protein
MSGNVTTRHRSENATAVAATPRPRPRLVEAPALVFSVTCLSSGLRGVFSIPGAAGDKSDLLERLKSEAVKRLGLPSNPQNLIVVTEDLQIIRGARALRKAVVARARRQLKSVTAAIARQLQSDGTASRVAGLSALWELCCVPDHRTDVLKQMALVVPLLSSPEPAVSSLASAVCWMWCVASSCKTPVHSCAHAAVS